jgi:hypothetical protein
MENLLAVDGNEPEGFGPQLVALAQQASLCLSLTSVFEGRLKLPMGLRRR